jgi:hypothetical protein
MRIVFDLGSSCQRNFANQARAQRHNMRYLLQHSAETGKPTLSFRRAAASFNKGAAGNSRCHCQLRLIL